MPVDKKLTAKILGFSKVQENPLSCQHSRGKLELAVLQALSQAMITLSKLSQDVLLFTTYEFSFFKLEKSLATGSSIMPNKNNLDVLELVRGNSGVVLNLANQVGTIITGLPSGYNRDLQLTKASLMQGIKITTETIKIMKLVFEYLKPNKSELKKAMSEDLFATDKAYQLVLQGIPFRQAYKQVKIMLEKGGDKNEK